jgi:CIC family chloride channel protein
LPATERERRVLMVAGVAAGISAVFRTPLGAALLAIEVLYRDDFESEALIPAVLASVVAYSLSASVLSTAPMFGALPRFPFRWEHLPFYGMVAVVVALAASAFVKLLAAVRRAAARLPGPTWTRPALGGLALGGLAVVVFVTIPGWLEVPAAHVATLGGGYGSGQLAITGDPALGVGSAAALALVAIAAIRALATALTIGTGGSAGDFAPSLAIGRRWAARSATPRRRLVGVDGSRPAPSRWWAWPRSTAAPPTCRWRRRSWCARWPAATTCWCR